MTYAIDTEGTGHVGSALLSSGRELRDCGTAFAYAGGLAQRGVAADHAAVGGAVERFVTTHLAAIEVIASATSALAGNLTWAAQSAHQVWAGRARSRPSTRPGAGSDAGAGA